MALPSAARLQSLIGTLQAGLLERDTAARIVLLAALAREHALLIGPPGTAKSELARRLHRVVADAGYFERLLTRFSTPEELFGPLSLKALEDDRYERLVAGFLPTAGIAFLDEVFKANSAILNALLTLLNEREFDNGSGRAPTPLVCVVAASNEVPVDEALQAFYDRFLLRLPVQPVRDEAFAALLQMPDTAVPAPLPLQAAERAAVQSAAAQVRVGAGVVRACQALRQWLAAQGVALSDRRWRQCLALMRTVAATEGRPELDALDLWLAPYVASSAPEWAPRIAMWFETELLRAVPQPLPWLTRAVEAFERQLEIEQTAPAEGAEGDDGAGKLALARSLAARDEGESGMLRLVSSTLEASLRRRYSPVHVAARLAQLGEVLQRAAEARAAVGQDEAALRALLHPPTGPRLWLPPELLQRLDGAHAQTLALLDGLVARLQQARAGFVALPLDEAAAQADAPAPVAIEPA